jgi:small subunit ribosomal protein S6
MQNYEIMFILNPNATEEEIDKINAQLEGIITAGGGKVGKIEKMGKRRLAYLVNKFKEGSYVLFVTTADGAIIREIERRLRVMDLVIKYLTVRMDEDMKRLDKIKAHRQKRADRRGRAHAAGAEGGSARRAVNPMDQMAEE